MAIDERTRHEMYSGLEDTLGAKVADALMAHLPPVGWADVATKHDLARLEARLDEDITRIEARIADVHRLMLWLFSTQLAIVGAMIAVAKVT